MMCILFFFFKEKTEYEMRIRDWSSDVCSSDLNKGTKKEKRQMCAGTPIWVGKHKSSSSQESGHYVGFFSCFHLFLLCSRMGTGSVRRRPIADGAKIGSASWRDRVCQYV